MLFIFSGLFFLIDFFLKYLFQSKLLFNKSIPIIKDLLYLKLAYNTGAAFGVFQGNNIFFITIGIIFLVIFISWVVKLKPSFPNNLYFAMILGGACSNLVDRIFLGYVVDYIYLRFWSIFNLSDVFITVGCILIVFTQFKFNEKNCSR